MSTPTRSLLSASIGPGLTLATALSTYANGPLATTTTIVFGLTLIWGIVEIALLSYTPIASIELDGASLLEIEESSTDSMDTTEAGNIVAFSDPNPWRERAA